MRFSTAEIAKIVDGRLVGDDVECDGASIDSRTIGAGVLFVPVVAERDGHEFIDAAVAAGAAAYLTHGEPQGGIAIVVDDTARALTKLGAAARDRHVGPVVGITGSVGKTSVKDLALAAIAAERRAHASPNSFNNELGVPLTLINAPPDAEVLIVEMGARGVGHIADLCAIARPTIGVVTWVGAVHTSEFGSIEAVARAKAELVESLDATGTAILNNENEYVAAMAGSTAAQVVRYGDGGSISASAIDVDGELRPRFTVEVGGQTIKVALQVAGVHNVANALAAIAAAQAVGVSLLGAAAGLAAAKLSPWRMEISRASSGATIINDAYNANAISTAAALDSLAALSARRRVAVLGVMAELGETHEADHRAMTDRCTELGIELIAYQESAYGVAAVDDFDQVTARLGPLGTGDAVLVKASRVAELENLVDRLLEA